ncbi:hypothetical protein GL4_2256 [Methyloceanibacter caenitepidi]|uniref:Uncharacterized protein n=1 Tax=Methyloceanibacter caenitepidi TaxID=1384459 RepID=A0A0A8K426_9HYPH|nr:hypothetical protein GL4_2256 [Methyloceanibacter caenitepidi]
MEAAKCSLNWSLGVGLVFGPISGPDELAHAARSVTSALVHEISAGP